jgi:hypothetical protein
MVFAFIGRPDVAVVEVAPFGDFVSKPECSAKPFTQIPTS